MNGLDTWQRRETPPWCFITVVGQLVTPKHSTIWIPRDAARALDIYWDGLVCRARYYTWDYGEVYVYAGRSLPTEGSQWRREHYVPAPELEALIVNLAGTEIDFELLELRVRRPRMEIAAIMSQHGYNGWACALHRGKQTQLLEITYLGPLPL